MIKNKVNTRHQNRAENAIHEINEESEKTRERVLSLRWGVSISIICAEEFRTGRCEEWWRWRWWYVRQWWWFCYRSEVVGHETDRKELELLSSQRDSREIERVMLILSTTFFKIHGSNKQKIHSCQTNSSLHRRSSWTSRRTTARWSTKWTGPTKMFLIWEKTQEYMTENLEEARTRLIKPKKNVETFDTLFHIFIWSVFTEHYDLAKVFKNIHYG